jgi:ribosomal protein S18 acetylase RimI-like enzyme
VVEEISPAALEGALLGELYEIYCAALERSPEDEQAREWVGETLPRHAQRDDFVFLAAREPRAIVGFAYGYTGAYGQWWTDLVAGAMEEETRRAWLDPPHFEVVELHVRPAYQRRGIGSRLLAELLARQPHDSAVLTADPLRPQPLPFYSKHGWRKLAEVQFSPSSSPRVVLGRRA